MFISSFSLAQIKTDSSQTTVLDSSLPFKVELAKYQIDSAFGGKTFLNVIKAFNLKNQIQHCIIAIELPKDWKCETFEGDTEVSIDPKSRKLLPVRIKPPLLCKQDSLYSVKVLLKDTSRNIILSEKKFTVSLLTIKDWEVKTLENNISWQTENEQTKTVNLKIKNKGNVNQTISFHPFNSSYFELIGKKIKNITLPPFSDTTLSLELKYIAEIPRNKTTIIFKFSNEENKVKTSRVNVSFTYSKYDANKERLDLNKLETTYGQRNITNKENRLSFFRTNGKFNLTNNRTLQYNININNFSKSINDNRTWIQQQQFNGFYRVRNSKVFIENVNQIGPFNINATNFGYLYKNKKHELKTAGGYLNMQKGRQASVLYQYNPTDSLHFKLGLMNIKEDELNMNTIAPLFGIDLITHTKHRLNSWFGINYSNRNTTNTNWGFGGNMRYSLTRDKISIFSRNILASKYFRSSLNNGINNSNGISYKLNTKNSIRFIHNYTTFKPLISFNQNNRLPGEQKLNRASLQYNLRKKINYNIGCVYEDSFLEKTLGTIPFGAIQYSLYNELASYRLKNFKFNLRLESGFSKVTILEDSLSNDEELVPITFITSRISLYDVNISARYNRGPDNFSQQAKFFQDGVFSERFVLSVSYRKQIKKYLDINLSFGNSRNLTLKENTFLANSTINIYLLKSWVLTMGIRVNTFDFDQYFNNNDATALNPYALDVSLKKVFTGIWQAHKPSNLKVKVFKDQNNNGRYETNEEELENITLDISPQNLDDKYINQSIQLSTNDKGEALYENIPRGKYALDIKTTNTTDGFVSASVWSDSTLIQVNKNSKILVPFQKGLIIKGKLKLNRAKYSKFNNISVARTRILITNDNGEQLYTLTDEEGNFQISVPLSKVFTITVKNVFGSKFIIPKKQIKISDDSKDEYIIDLVIKEKARKINFR